MFFQIPPVEGRKQLAHSRCKPLWNGESLLSAPRSNLLLVCVNLCISFPSSYRPKVTPENRMFFFFFREIVPSCLYHFPTCVLSQDTVSTVCIHIPRLFPPAVYNLPLQGCAQLLQSPVDGHLGWFHFISQSRPMPVNLCVHASHISMQRDGQLGCLHLPFGPANITSQNLSERHIPVK